MGIQSAARTEAADWTSKTKTTTTEKVETGLFYAREKWEVVEGKEKEAWDFFPSKCVLFDSHDSKRITVKLSRSAGIDGVF